MASVRVAILGCGGMGRYHARRLKNNPDAEIVALCDVEPNNVQALLEESFPSEADRPAVFSDPASMYAEARPDGVVIVTPHTMHFSHGMQALEAGCHVLMEKPMVTDSAQAHQLAEHVRETGKIFVIGYNTPCTPEFKYLRQLIRSRELGKLELVSGWLVQDWKRFTTDTWRQDPALSGGGQLYDSGAHLLNSLVWSVEQSVQQVHAFVDNFDTPVDVNGTINVRFVDGTLAAIAIGGNCPNDGAGMIFAFEGGRVEIDGWGGSWIRVFRRGQEQVKYPPITAKPDSPDDNFVDAILGRAEPLTSPRNGVIQSELMDAIYESARTGQVVRVPQS